MFLFSYYITVEYNCQANIRKNRKIIFCRKVAMMVNLTVKIEEKRSKGTLLCEMRGCRIWRVKIVQNVQRFSCVQNEQIPFGKVNWIYVVICGKHRVYELCLKCDKLSRKLTKYHPGITPKRPKFGCFLIDGVNDIYYPVHKMFPKLQNARRSVRKNGNKGGFRSISGRFWKKWFSSYLLTSFRVCGMISSWKTAPRRPTSIV